MSIFLDGIPDTSRSFSTTWIITSILTLLIHANDSGEYKVAYEAYAGTARRRINFWTVIARPPSGHRPGRRLVSPGVRPSARPSVHPLTFHRNVFSSKRIWLIRTQLGESHQGNVSLSGCAPRLDPPSRDTEIRLFGQISRM